jgi:hypothetical protein
MSRIPRTVAVLCAVAVLGTAGSAAAQGVQAGAASAQRLSALRLEIGGASVSRGVYCAYGYFTTNCSSASFPFTPLIYSAELDFGMSKPLGVALAARYINGAYYSRNVGIWEPTADLVLRFGSYTAGPSFRLRLGVGGYIARAGNTGVVGRTGFGFSIRGHSPWALALDVTWETGSFRGNTIYTVQYMIGPEFGF